MHGLQGGNQLLCDHPSLVLCEESLRRFVCLHESVKISTGEVGEYHNELSFPGNQLLQRHDVVLVIQLNHEFYFLLDIQAQIFLDDLGSMHALQTEHSLGADMPRNKSDSNHAAAYDATDFVGTNLSINFSLGH